MGRAGGLLASLLCSLLLGVLLPGGAVETPDEEDTLPSPTSGLILPVSAESEVDLSAGTTSPPLSTAPKDTGVVPPGTIGPEEMGQTTEAVTGTERPVSEEDSGSKATTTVVSSRGDTPAEDYGNNTAIVGPVPTDEVVPTDPSITVEVVKTTQGPSSTPPGDETATLVVTKMVSSTPSEPTSSQANRTKESTQSPGEAGATLQNGTEVGDTTRTLDVLTSTTRATTILTSTIAKGTTAASTTLIPSAEPTSKVASADGKHEPSVLDVGDDEKDIPGVTNRALSNTDPLVVAVISIFIVMVGILAVVGFLRYRQRTSRTEFRRLQDLPMDDMMEDTPLSLYSY